jgi:hypothetical protein
MGTEGTMGLPQHVDRLRLLREPSGQERLLALVRPAEAGYEAHVVDEEGRVYLVLEGYRTVPLPAGVDEGGLLAVRAAMAGAVEPALSR